MNWLRQKEIRKLTFRALVLRPERISYSSIICVQTRKKPHNFTSCCGLFGAAVGKFRLGLQFSAIRVRIRSHRREELKNYPAQNPINVRTVDGYISYTQFSPEVSESQLIFHRVGVFLVQLYVNNEEMQVRKLISCYPTQNPVTQDRRII